MNCFITLSGSIAKTNSDFSMKSNLFETTVLILFDVNVYTTRCWTLIGQFSNYRLSNWKLPAPLIRNITSLFKTLKAATRGAVCREQVSCKLTPLRQQSRGRFYRFSRGSSFTWRDEICYVQSTMSYVNTVTVTLWPSFSFFRFCKWAKSTLRSLVSIFESKSSPTIRRRLITVIDVHRATPLFHLQSAN